MVLGSVADIITALGTAIMAAVAIFALRTWRKEFVGKKKIELAAQIMQYVYDIQDMLIGVRLPTIAKTELDDAYEWIKRETELHPGNAEVYPERVKYLVPHRRLSKKQEIINKFRRLQNPAYMYWGKEMIVAFVKLTAYNLKIMQASKQLYYGEDTPEYKPLYDIIFYEIKDNKMDPNDKINAEIDTIVEEFRINLEPLYKDKKTSWKALDSTGKKQTVQ